METSSTDPDYRGEMHLYFLSELSYFNLVSLLEF